MVRDSAGVSIVENGAPIWPGGHLWSLDPAPLVSIGGEQDGGGRFLYRVQGAFQVPSTGEMFVANQGTLEILVFDSLGTFVRSTGGSGEGPGELMGLYGFYPCGDSGFLVYEGPRVSQFDLNGAFLGSRRPKPGDGALRVEGVSSDCSALTMVSWSSDPPLEGVIGVLPGRISWDDESAEGRTLLATFPRAEVQGRTIDGYLGGYPFPWARTAEWVTRGDRVYLGTSERAEIRVFDPGMGLARVIRWDAPAPRISAADRRRYDQERDRLIDTNPGSASYYPVLQDVHVPDRKPASSRLVIDSRGNLWVEEYPFWAAGMKWALFAGHPNDPAVRWTVFDPDGRLLGFVALPPDIQVVSIGEDRLLGIWRDEWDAEHVQVFHLKKRQRPD